MQIKLKPLFNYKISNFHEEFIIISLISALGAIIAIKANENMREKINKCIKNKSTSLRCQIISHPNLYILELFIITFVSTYITYLFFHFVIGYGFHSLDRIKNIR
jgi:hypothetical protein